MPETNEIAERHHSLLSSKAEVKESKIHGRGVFAKELIYKGERAAAFGGHIITAREMRKLARRDQELSIYPFQVDEYVWMGPVSREELDFAECFNHSCDPNAGFEGQIMLVAMRDIQPGEEITFDYVMCEFQDFEMECHCGSLGCRGIIKSSDWENPELQKRYKDYFSWAIIQKIKEAKGEPYDRVVWSPDVIKKIK